MKIAIQAADLDASRIDGTRVYIKQMLKYFGALSPGDEFLIYHKNTFNPELEPPKFPNYQIEKRKCPFFWTQLRLSSALLLRRPDVLWMPMHNIPLIRDKKMKTVVTIHDLAFKYFPETFAKKDLFKINLLTRLAVGNADKIITVSESSKRDILKFYPQVKEKDIRVIYHGFDGGVFFEVFDNKKIAEVLSKYGIDKKMPDGRNYPKYILYVGAIQPRKNLGVLVKAFSEIKKNPKHKNLKLILAGEKAWKFKKILEEIKKSLYAKDIFLPGKIKFGDLGHLMRGAEVFCFPSLYEGFGIPILEAFAARVPVVCARNSSLPEVGGEAALYFDGEKTDEMVVNLEKVLEDKELKKKLLKKGLEQTLKFSWEKCARETLEYLKES